MFVGHTHEDVDACFSKIAEKLKRNDAETIPELKQHLPNVTELDHMLDIRSWLLPSLAVVKKHTVPHHFRFLIKDAKVVGEFKFQQQSAWEQIPSVFRWLPKRKPSILRPNYDNIDIDRLQKQIESMKCFFSDETKTLKWWERFLMTLRRKKVGNVASKFLECLPRQKETNTEETRNVIPAELKKLIQKEKEGAPVRYIYTCLIPCNRKFQNR